MRTLLGFIRFVIRLALVLILLALIFVCISLSRYAESLDDESRTLDNPVVLAGDAQAGEVRPYKSRRYAVWVTPRGRSAEQLERGGRNPWEKDPRGVEALRYERGVDKEVCDRFRERAAGQWGIVAVGREVDCDTRGW